MNIIKKWEINLCMCAGFYICFFFLVLYLNFYPFLQSILKWKMYIQIQKN